MNPKLQLKENDVVVAGLSMWAVLDSFPGPDFTRGDFVKQLLNRGLDAALDGDFVRKLLQAMKRKEMVAYYQGDNIWVRAANQGRPLKKWPESIPGQTIPLTSASSPPLVDRARSERINHLAEQARLVISALACLTLLSALIGLNASFAWELGREATQFQFLFTMSVTALDMMRPGFVMIGFHLNGCGRVVLGSIALTVALALSPVSVLSTTSILSASFLLGAEFNSDSDTRARTREALRVQHQNLLQRAAQDEAAWRQECARGGCGPIALELEAEFQQTVDEAQNALDRIVALTEAEQGNSELLARMVTTFEQLGLFGADREILLPLFLAISLELGALFGPALLLRRRRHPGTP